jgi:hypothetical protein
MTVAVNLTITGMPSYFNAVGGTTVNGSGSGTPAPTVYSLDFSKAVNSMYLPLISVGGM